MLYAKKRDEHSNHARTQGDQVCSLVAKPALGALERPSLARYRVVIVDAAVDQVEDLAEDCRAQRHESPVL